MANDTLAPVASMHREPRISMHNTVIPAPDSGLKCPVIINPTWGLGLGFFVCLFFRAVKRGETLPIHLELCIHFPSTSVCIKRHALHAA